MDCRRRQERLHIGHRTGGRRTARRQFGQCHRRPDLADHHRILDLGVGGGGRQGEGIIIRAEIAGRSRQGAGEGDVAPRQFHRFHRLGGGEIGERRRDIQLSSVSGGRSHIGDDLVGRRRGGGAGQIAVGGHPGIDQRTVGPVLEIGARGAGDRRLRLPDEIGGGIDILGGARIGQQHRRGGQFIDETLRRRAMGAGIGDHPLHGLGHGQQMRLGAGQGNIGVIGVVVAAGDIGGGGGGGGDGGVGLGDGGVVIALRRGGSGGVRLSDLIEDLVPDLLKGLRLDLIRQWPDLFLDLLDLLKGALHLGIVQRLKLLDRAGLPLLPLLIVGRRRRRRRRRLLLLDLLLHLLRRLGEGRRQQAGGVRQGGTGIAGDLHHLHRRHLLRHQSAPRPQHGGGTRRIEGQGFAAGGGDADLARKAALFRHHGDGIVVAGQTGAANAHRHGGCLEFQRVGRGLGDLARHQGERTADQGQMGVAGLGPRIIGQFVEDQPPLLAQRHGGAVGEHHADRAALVGLQDIALENGIALVQFAGGAVGVPDMDAAILGLDLADGGLAGGAARLGVLARRQRPGQLGGQGAVDDSAGVVQQRRRRLGREIIMDQHPGAVGADQHQIGTVAHILGHQQEITARHHDLGHAERRHLHHGVIGDHRMLAGHRLVVIGAWSRLCRTPRRAFVHAPRLG